MWLKLLIALVFIGIVVSLAAGAGFLLHDESTSRRLLTSLKWRIALAKTHTMRIVALENKRASSCG